MNHNHPSSRIPYASVVVKDLLKDTVFSNASPPETMKRIPESDPGIPASPRRLRKPAKKTLLHPNTPLHFANAVKGSLKNTTAPYIAQQPYRYYCVLDIEATCDENNPSWYNEIIEFPVVLIDAKTLTRVAEFRSFVKPVRNPVLTEFCTRLTGITQEQVNTAPHFPQVLRNFRHFLKKYHLGTWNMRFITDGPCDIRDFVWKTCKANKVSVPSYFRGFVNVRKLAQRNYAHTGIRINFDGMLKLFDLVLEGRHHSGIDDTRNIARVVLKMMEDGVLFKEHTGY
ncbi:3'-5' exoribonuclease 1 [Chytriomyces hyalinus]|nr:3'-5' exoribonuclease 1 [Chytriomyces hyalinus]